jgi:hypothetical protein
VNLVSAARVLIFPWANNHAVEVTLGRPAHASRSEIPPVLLARCHRIEDTWMGSSPGSRPALRFIGPAWVVASIVCWWQMRSERKVFYPLVQRLDAAAREAARLWDANRYAVEVDEVVEVELDRGAVETAAAIVATYQLFIYAPAPPEPGVLRELLLSMGPP